MVPKKPKWMPWKLASKLDKKFEEFGIKISKKKDLGWEAWLEMLHDRCQGLESLITELSKLPVDVSQWEKLTDLVVDIGVEVNRAKELCVNLEGPLDRLLGQITSIGDPERHLKDLRSEASETGRRSQGRRSRQEGRRENGEGK